MKFQFSIKDFDFSLFPEPFELARHSSTSSNECIDHGAGNRPTFESELEEYEEPINQETKEKLPSGSKISSEESTSGLTEDNENDRKRYSSSIHSKGIFKLNLKANKRKIFKIKPDTF